MKTSTSFILLLISVGLFFTFTNSQYRKVEELRLAASEYQDILDNASALSTRRDELLSKYRNIPKTKVDSLAKALPNNVNIVRLSVDLDTIASRYGISIKSIQVTKDKEEGNSTIIANPKNQGVGRVIVSFSFVSSYDNFKRFLRDIENSLRIVNLKSLDFQSTENGLYQYKVSIETYWLK